MTIGELFLSFLSIVVIISSLIALNLAERNIERLALINDNLISQLETCQLQ